MKDCFVQQVNAKYQHLVLKDNLIQRFDFEAVNSEIWSYFKAWYGCDYTLLRFVKKDGASGELYIELYPEKIL